MTKNINKITLFLSALAIVLIVLLMLRFKGLSLFKTANADELSKEETLTEIYDYIDSLDGFTDEQKEALSTIIEEYMKDNNVLTEEDEASIYALIDGKYQSNRTYVESIKTALEQELASTSTADTAHYNQLKSLIDEVNNWLNQSNTKQAEANSSFSTLIQDLRAYTDSQDTTLSTQLNELINQLAKSTADEIKSLQQNLSTTQQNLSDTQQNLNNTKQDLSDTKDELTNTTSNFEKRISDLEKQTSEINDDDKTYFEFGYQNGCYGYYAADGFKPF